MLTPEINTGSQEGEGVGTNHSNIINAVTRDQVGTLMNSGIPVAIAQSIIIEVGERINMENSEIFFIIKKNKEIQPHEIESILIDFWGFCDSKTLLSKSGLNLNGFNKEWIVKWEISKELHLKDNSGEKTILIFKISPDRETIQIINESKDELYTQILYLYMDHLNSQLRQ